MDPSAAALWMADRLFTGSFQGAAVIALVWISCRAVPRLPASVQAALWWLAALKLVLALLPLPLVAVPVLPPPDASPAPAAVTAGAPIGSAHTPDAERRPSTASTVSGVEWRTALVAVWLAVVGLQAGRLVRERALLRAVVRRARPAGAEESALVLRIARALAMRHVPAVRQSDEISGPQVAGVVRPVVLVPADGARLTPHERTMAICHELMHLRRHDLVLAWMPAIAERLFFFHPLARVMGREYLAAREAACDAAVIRALDVSPEGYGRLLVRLGVAGPAPAFAARGSSNSHSTLRRRLTMLQHASSTGAGTRRIAWCLGALVLLSFMPFQIVARTAAQGPQPARPVIAVPAAPAVAPAPAAPPVREVRREVPARAAAPRPVAPAAPVMRVPAPARPVAPAASPREPAPAALGRNDAARDRQQLDADFERLARELAAQAGERQAEEYRELLERAAEAARIADIARARAQLEQERAEALRAAQSDTLNAAQADPALSEQIEQIMRAQQMLVEQQRQEITRRDETIVLMREMLEQMRAQMSDVERMRTALMEAIASMRTELRRSAPRD